MTFRCYNGAWDSAAMRLFAQQDALLEAIKVIEPEAHCTLFPEEGLFQVHRWGRPLSGFHRSRIAALQEALEKLHGRKA